MVNGKNAHVIAHLDGDLAAHGSHTCSKCNRTGDAQKILGLQTILVKIRLIRLNEEGLIPLTGQLTLQLALLNH